LFDLPFQTKGQLLLFTAEYQFSYWTDSFLLFHRRNRIAGTFLALRYAEEVVLDSSSAGFFIFIDYRPALFPLRDVEFDIRREV
jgi:hypothetical protein